MYSKIVLRTIAIIALVSVQIAFIDNLPGYFNNINLILIALVFILMLGSFKEALWWAFGAGILCDVFSFNPFGLYLVSLVLVVIFANFLQVSYFTDRTLYSVLALTSLSLLCDRLILQLAKYAVTLFDSAEIRALVDSSFWKHELSGIALSLVLAAVIFYVINYMSNRLKPVFLVRKRG